MPDKSFIIVDGKVYILGTDSYRAGWIKRNVFQGIWVTMLFKRALTDSVLRIDVSESMVPERFKEKASEKGKGSFWVDKKSSVLKLGRIIIKAFDPPESISAIMVGSTTVAVWKYIEGCSEDDPQEFVLNVTKKEIPDIFSNGIESNRFRARIKVLTLFGAGV